MNKQTSYMTSSSNKLIVIMRLVFLIYVIALNSNNGCEGYPTTDTTTDIIPNEETERNVAPLEIEVTEIPPTFTESENEVENAATELTINFDTETLNNNTLSELDSDNNNDETTLTPTMQSSSSFSDPSSASIVEMEIIDTNTAAEELDQTTATTTTTTTTKPTTNNTTDSTTTHLIEDDIIVEAEDEPHPDKKEILNELQNIWYFTEELNELDEDQKTLKSSLSSLIHMTYARVYDQSDETLARLKFLLRRLRSRLLDQNIERSKSKVVVVVDSDDPIEPVTTTTVPDINLVTEEDVNFSKNITQINGTDTLKNNPINKTLEKQDGKPPSSPIIINAREKRSLTSDSQQHQSSSSLSQQKSKGLDGDAIFGMVDSDENSLFQQPIDKRDKLLFSLVTETSNDNDIPKIPSNSHSFSEEEERIKMAKKVIGEKNANNLKVGNDGPNKNNLVHLSIYQPGKNKNKNGIITANYHHPNSTMSSSSSTHSLFSSMSQFSPSSSTKKPHTNTKYQPISPHYTLLKQKYSIVKTTTTTTENPKFEENVNNYMGSANNSLSTMDDIIQSIIDVLGTPIPRPSNLQNNSGEYVFDVPQSSQNQNSPIFDTLPSYLQKFVDELGLGSNNNSNNNSSNFNSDLTDRNFTKLTMMTNNNSSSSLDNEMDDAEIVDLSSPSSPIKTTVLNGTIEKVYGVINSFSNLPNAARFVLFFSITISIASIALGLYSLAPPITAVGVLGIIFPVLMIFLLLRGNNSGKKKKSKIDIVNQLSIDDFAQALDMIADAMIKYDKH